MFAGEIRLWGDPLRQDTVSVALRAVLREAHAVGLRCGLCVSGAAGDNHGRGVPFTDGVSQRRLLTTLDDTELQPVLAAVQQPIAASAPVLVFGDADDAVRAELEFARACVVLDGTAQSPRETVARLVRFLRSVSRHDRPAALPESELVDFVNLPPPPGAGHVWHAGSRDPRAGTDVAVRAFAELGHGRMTVLLPGADPELERDLRALAARQARRPVDLRFVAGALVASQLADVDVVLLPARAFVDLRPLIVALASARPVIITRTAQSARVLDAPGLCLPIGGAVREVAGEISVEPDRGAVLRQLRAAFTAAAADLGRRARDHVWTNWRTAQPRSLPARARRRRPVVVLEAPLFELSSAAELTISTARALAARDRVDLHLVPRQPWRRGVAALRARAPELVARLDARPPIADLWLSAGWPPRADRPAAGCWALRFDWEWGALPTELAPLLVHEADRVIVHSRAVGRVLANAGRPASTVDRIPLGVDATVFHENAAPCPRVSAFKRDRRALLFVGGLIWRKGVDVLLRMLLELRDRDRTCLVIKAVGGGDAYAGFHLAELIERVQAQPAAPEILLLDDERSPSAMAALYTACDLLVHPYRGEGFGLPVLEARACGLPVLVTAGGSTDDFCDGPGCVQIPAVRRPVELADPHISTPWVLEPDAAMATQQLQASLQRLDELRAAARQHAPDVRAAHTWTAAAARIEALACAAFAQQRRPAVERCDTVRLKAPSPTSR